MVTYRENMSASDLAAFMNEINELNACYESTAEDDRMAMESETAPEEWEDPSDYVGMGWIDSRGRP
jgi:hypothetical protein